VRRSIDLNADLGEGYGPWTMGDDPAMFGLVTSANIACGGHAGDPTPCSGRWSWRASAASRSARTPAIRTGSISVVAGCPPHR
jgi:hypothetical protein